MVLYRRNRVKGGTYFFTVTLRSCLAKDQTHFARVSFIMAIRMIFSEVAVRISKSLASRRKLFNQAKATVGWIER